MHQILDNWMCSHIYGECEFYKGFFFGFFFKTRSYSGSLERVWYGRRRNLSNKIR